MSFETVPATAYDRFMGRYAAPLSPLFADLAKVEPGHRVLDVGCGPGTLVGELVRRGAEVSAIDPSPPFVEAARARFPEADVRAGVAEELPWEDDAFDVVLAQLVVHFMKDPAQGVREMARVARPGGTVAACVWDHAGHRGPLSPFWQAVAVLQPSHSGQSTSTGSRAGDLGHLARQAGLVEVEEDEITVSVDLPSFEDWWEPYTRGVGPAGEFATRLGPGALDEVRDAALDLLGEGPFTITATAWTVRGTAQ